MEAVAEAVMDMQAMKRDKCGHDSFFKKMFPIICLAVERDCDTCPTVL